MHTVYRQHGKRYSFNVLCVEFDFDDQLITGMQAHELKTNHLNAWNRKPKRNEMERYVWWLLVGPIPFFNTSYAQRTRFDVWISTTLCKRQHSDFVQCLINQVRSHWCWSRVYFVWNFYSVLNDRVYRLKSGINKNKFASITMWVCPFHARVFLFIFSKLPLEANWNKYAVHFVVSIAIVHAISLSTVAIKLPVIPT